MKEKYKKYSLGLHPSNAGTVNSYIRGIDMIDRVLPFNEEGLTINSSIWDITDVQILNEILNIIDKESRKADGGIFRNEKSTSYWKKGFCHSALKEFIDFVCNKS